MRLFSRLAFAASVLVSNLGYAQLPREWQVKGLPAFKASYTDSDQSKVNLLSTDGTQQSFRFSELSELDQKYVTTQRFTVGDLEQFEMLIDFLPDLRQDSESVLERIEILSTKFTDAPYAPLWHGIAFGKILNEPKQSRLRFDEAIKRCETQRANDPLRHRRTLMSAYNNKAIALIKERDEKKAAVYFVKAFDVVGIGSPILNHNVRQFLEITGVRSFPRKPDESDRKKLLAFSSRDSAGNASRPLGVGYYYSLDVDTPSRWVNNLGLDQLELPEPSVGLASLGLGVVISKDTVLTVHDAVQPIDPSDFLATVATRREKQIFQLIANEVIIPDLPNRNHSAPPPSQTRGTRGDIQPKQTHIKSVPVSAGSVGEHLAVLVVPGLDIPPINFAKGQVDDQTDVIALGLKRSKTMLYDGAVESKPVKSIKTSTPFFFQSTIPVSMSTRGGPVVDKSSGVFLGLTYRTPRSKVTDEVRGEFISKESILDWLASSFSQVSLMNNPDADKGFERNVGGVRNATIPIMVWKSKGDLSDPKSLIVYTGQLKGAESSLAIRDPWCLNCRGEGLFKCNTCAGRRQVQDGFSTQVIGYLPGSNEPQVLKQPKYAPCRDCNATGKSVCPFCEHGRLPENSYGN